MKSPSLFFLIVLGMVPPAFADYVVDEDLGTLPEGTTTVSGSTALTVIDPGPPEITRGGNNNADWVANAALATEGNWGSEYVVQFICCQSSDVVEIAQ